MQVIERIAEIRKALAALRRERALDTGKEKVLVGFVPTMGYLHEGHLSLVRKAKEECDITVMSIFVNPLQFGPKEDFEKYPRDKERDLRLAEKEGVDIVFAPEVKEMYPEPIRTTVSVSQITNVLCGASRPGHFDGVATVVSKLFHIIEPDRAYFGLKDAQQVAVIEQMVRDLNMNLEIVPCPTVREPDGLAMSSRNVYLSPEERSQALIIPKTLELAEKWVWEEGMTRERLKERMVQSISTQPLARIDYAEILQYPSLTPPLEPLTQNERLIVALAVKFGQTRLIDNRLISLKEVRVNV